MDNNKVFAIRSDNIEKEAKMHITEIAINNILVKNTI